MECSWDCSERVEMCKTARHDLLIADTERSQNSATVGNSCKQIHIKRGGHSEETQTEFVFPCRTGEILQEGQPLSTAVFTPGGDLRQEVQDNPSEEKEEEAQDPDPDVKARQYFWSIVGDYVHRDHFAKRTKLYVPKDDFQIPLNCMFVQRQTKTSIDVLHEAIIDDY